MLIVLVYFLLVLTVVLLSITVHKLLSSNVLNIEVFVGVHTCTYT